MHHLNHGSFGAVPLEVQARQIEWRARWEANTTGFILNEYTDALDVARQELANFVGAAPAGLVFVRNASQGVASVIRTIEPQLKPGDEIVTTDQDYNAVRQTLEFSAATRGTRVVVAEVPFPIESPDQVLNSVLNAITARTRLVVIDHIASPTGLIFPIEEIVSEVEPDVPVLVDGAHGPGQVPLSLDALGASWYTGNLHKWVCAPKGSGFLHARADRIDDTVPTVISHAWNTPIVDGASRYHGLFDWVGTDDMTPWLTVPDAIGVVGRMESGGWPAVMKRNHELALEARRIICDVLAIQAPAPDEMVGSLFAIRLSDRSGEDPGGLLSPLNQELLDAGFETLVMVWPEWPHQIIRISAHLYNELDEYRLIADTLSQMGG
jgi:isopenicillin-N epimerase